MPVNKNGYGEALDVVSYNYHWKRADQDHIDFPHWKIGLLSEYSAARSRRGVYGVENFARADNDTYLDLYWGMVQSMYEMCSTVEKYWRRIKAREYMAGGCLWSGMDCWGEGNAWPLISRGDGAVDNCLFPKDVYYYFTSMWTEKPMAHLLPHWNWQGKDDAPIDVWCYTNCESAELFLNGNSLGTQTRPPEPAPWKPGQTYEGPVEKSETYPEHMEWKVPYEAGTLRVEGKRAGKVVFTKEIKTADDPTTIQLTPLMTTYVEEEKIPPLIADGRDIIVVKTSIVDKNGILVPHASNPVNFSVEGPGNIIGVGNGDIASHEANKTPSRRAYNGLCAVIIQTTPEPGNIIVRAESPGLKKGEITLTSIEPRPVGITLDASLLTLSTQDTLHVTATINDKFGSIIASNTSTVTMKIEGPGQFTNGKKTISVSAEKGKALASFIAEKGKGKIILFATNENLIPGKLDIDLK
jgi:beta-galactosidase